MRNSTILNHKIGPNTGSLTQLVPREGSTATDMVCDLLQVFDLEGERTCKLQHMGIPPSKIYTINYFL